MEKSFLKIIEKAAGTLNIRNSIYPLLWLCFLISLPCFTLAFCSTQVWLQITFITVGILPVIFTGCCYTYFMCKNPDYLRSEEYQIKKQSLGILGDKDHTLSGAEHIVNIANPLLLTTTTKDHE